MGIYNRKEETANALLSSYLWTENGTLTESGSKTFWDRSTLYAFRGLLNSGATERVMPYIAYYSSRRLLGDHVPYPVEAWPEGNQRHLSAESGLYCRVITEGLFGITPVGLNKFEILPRLPEEWSEMKLQKIKAFGKTFDIEVLRKGKKSDVLVTENGKVVFKEESNGESPLTVTL
jgi:cellobiose phosphorylase